MYMLGLESLADTLEQPSWTIENYDLRLWDSSIVYWCPSVGPKISLVANPKPQSMRVSQTMGT